MSSAITLANLLTLIRLILIPIFIMAIYYRHFTSALLIFLVAAITDVLDGLVARSFNQKTQLGAILDPMADKLLLVTAFIVLSAQGWTNTPPIPFWVTVAAISRDIFIVLGALVINIATGFSRFRPSIPGKINTFVQIATIVVFLAANAFQLAPGLVELAYYLTFGMVIFSGAHYIFHVNRLMNEEAQQ